MNNAKTIEVVEPVFGLEEGDVLSRNTNEENFTLVDEVIGDGYSSRRVFSISENLVDPNKFQLIEEFIKPDLELGEEDDVDKFIGYVASLEKRVDSLENEMNELVAKIKRNGDRFYAEYKKAKEALGASDEDDERAQWNEEAVSVYKNLFDFTDRLLA